VRRGAAKRAGDAAAEPRRRTHRSRDPAGRLDGPAAALHVTTRAKVNLSLEVIRRRSDGYHEVETVLQAIDLADQMRVEVTGDGRIEIACDDPAIPTDERNLCHRAVVAMRPLAGPSLGARVTIAKRIPAGAGLGGGSSNAAGMVLAIQHALDLPASDRDLARVAAGLGSDVPFFLHGGTMLGRGRGEILVALQPLKRGVFVIVKPEVSIPTAWVYSHLSFRLTSHRGRLNLRSVNSVLARFPRATLPFRNALEDVVLQAYPAVARLLEELLAERPCFASMSGSGSAVFAIFESEERAREVARRFSVRGLFTSVAKPAKQAVDIR
jgi:4-diphosphocytidyl-2-C-methyl-D-erythritol kinase